MPHTRTLTKACSARITVSGMNPETSSRLVPHLQGGWGTRRAGHAALYLVLAGVAVGTFVQTLTYPFVYDDRYIIERNPAITSPGGWLRVFASPYWPPEHSFDPLYRPITTLSFKLNYALTGDRPVGFRTVNLALHALATVLVAAFARRLWGRTSAAWVAGLLFATHPLHAEALGLVVGRAELLAGVLVAAMLLRHLGRDAISAAPSARYHLTTALLFLLALGVKEHAIIAWPAVLLIDMWHRRRAPNRQPLRWFLRRTAASHHLGLIIAAAVFLFMRWAVFGWKTTLASGFVNPFANPLIYDTPTARVATSLALLWLVVRQWFLATPLCPIWGVGGFDRPETLIRGDVLAGAALGLVIVLCFVFARRGGRRVWLTVGLFALGVLLPCHFFPAANWLYAERWLYLPSMFLAVLCAGLAVWVPRFSVAGSTLAAALLLATTIPYNRCWATHEGLFESVVERQPFNYHGLVGLLAVRQQTGRLGESRIHVERLTERFPGARKGWYFKILLAHELEDWDAAAEALRRWGALRPPGPVPPKIARITREVRAHGR